MIARVDRSRLPELGRPAGFTFPAIEKSTLANGLRIWTVRQRQIPIVAFVLFVARGSSTDPPGQEGLAATTADMLDEGSGNRSAIEVHEALARLGATFDTDIGSDATSVSVTVLSRVADRALGLLGDVVVRPALNEADFARVRQLRLHRLMQLRDSPGAVADRAFLKLVYGDDPYGHSPIGSESALAALNVGDIRSFHERVIRPTVATLIAVGDCEHEAITRLAAETFGDWSGRTDQEIPSLLALPQPSRMAVVPRPRAPQSELRIGHVAAARNTPDYHTLAVANTILGGQFVSRINLNLRVDKGYTYGARTAFEFRRRPGPFVLQVSVQTAATARAVEESIGEIAGIRGPRPVTNEELELSIAALTRGYARNFETCDQIARAIMQLVLHDLPDDYYAQFVPTIERVRADEVSAAMERHIDPARLTTLVVGDLDAVGRDLENLGLGTPLVLPPDAF